jgi:hypothetical protein
MPVFFKAAATNTGPATLNVNGLGAKAIKKSGNQPLTAGDVLAGQICAVVDDGTNFQLLSRGQAAHADKQISYGVDTGSANAPVVALTPPLESYVAGIPVFFKAAAGNTGPVTLNVNSLGAKGIKKRGNVELNAGDIRAGQICVVIYDGVNFQLLTPAYSDGVPVGTVIMKESRRCPAGYLPIEGDTVLRALYAGLLDDYTTPQVVTLQLDAALLVQAPAHGLAVGDKVSFSTTGALPEGLATATLYYIIAAGFTEDSFRVSLTPGGAAVVGSGAQAGTHTVYCWNVAGPGDWLTTFQLPDRRGEFFRAWDNGRGTDPDRVFGSAQTDAVKSHSHEQYLTGSDADSGQTVGNYPSGSIYNNGARWSGYQTSGFGGTETRPKNIAARFFVKY